MKNVPKDDYGTFQKGILDRMADAANEEAERILQRVKSSDDLTDEDRQKLSATDIAGRTWIDKEIEKAKKAK